MRDRIKKSTGSLDFSISDRFLVSLGLFCLPVHVRTVNTGISLALEGSSLWCFEKYSDIMQEKFRSLIPIISAKVFFLKLQIQLDLYLRCVKALRI